MIDLVITGGQTGADQAGWRAAKVAGIRTAGSMPSGFLTEDGPRPEFAALYGATEMPTATYPARTRVNVVASDVTLVFCAGVSGYRSPGTQLTMRICQELGRACRTMNVLKPPFTPAMTADWLRDCCHILNVAGNRESKYPGIGAAVEAYMAEVFRLLKETR